MTTNPYDADPRTLQRLARAASDAEALGRERDPGGGPNIDAVYNSRHVLGMARRLTLPEIAVLLHASGTREQALAEARARRLDEATTLMREARREYEDAGLSAEATAIAHSFQDAAEAFLEFTCGRHEAAKARLASALASCVELRERYGYSVEVRRVHLARNAVRVMTLAGEHAASMRLAAALIDYVVGAGPWPVASIGGACAADPLTEDEQLLLLDQLLGEVALLLPRDGSGAGLLGCAPALSVEPASPFFRVRVWLTARRALVEGEIATFLRWTLLFFDGQPGRLRRAWQELAGDLSAVRATLEAAPRDRTGLLAAQGQHLSQAQFEDARVARSSGVHLRSGVA